MKRKVIAAFIILSMCFSSTSLFAVAQEPYKGHIEETDLRNQNAQEIFTNEETKLEGNKVVQLTVSQVLAGSTSVEGDEFFAEVSEDVLAGGGVLLPKGTVAHGTIKNIVDPKRMGRDGYLELGFDYLITPDGREIPIEGNMTSKLHPAKSVAKVTGENIAYTAVGGAIGAMAAVELAGIPAAVASQGYTVAGGAIIGGVIALGMSFFRKGSDVLVAPGDEIKVKIVSSAPIQVVKPDAFRQKEMAYDGLDVRINDIWLEKDPFGNLNTYTLDLIIKNASRSDFSSFDIKLVNDLHNTYNPSIFMDYKNSLAMKTIKKGENVSGVLSFSVDNPNRQHWLVFYDRATNKPLAKISIDNSIKDLNITDLVKNKKKKKKRA